MYSVKRKLLGAALAIVLNGALVSDVMAQSKEIWMEIPADAPIGINLQGHKYSVPAAYIMPWPLRPMMQGMTNLRVLWFAYWFPDKTPILEKSPELRSQVDPRTEGASLADEFIVQAELSVINAEGKLAANDRRFVKPLQKYKNYVIGIEEQFPGHFKRTEKEAFTILEDRVGQLVYVSKPDSDPQFYLSCGRPTAPNPVCFGDAYYRETSFVLFIRIPRVSMERLPEVISSTRNLVDAWAIK